MTTQPNLKSAGITNLDSTPPIRNTAGHDNGLTRTMEIVGIAGPTTDGDTTGGVLRLVRVPSNAIIKRVMYAQKAATTTAAFSFGIYYSDTADGTSPGNVAGTATAIMSTLSSASSGYNAPGSTMRGAALQTMSYERIRALYPSLRS